MNIDSKDQKVMPMDYTKLEQSARQALECCEDNNVAGAILALREALKQPDECPHGVDDGACKECYMEQTEQPVSQEPFPKPKFVAGNRKEPCGECHLPYGETCDICGASNPVNQKPVSQEPVAFADKYGNVMKAKEKLISTNVRDNWYDRPLYEKMEFNADLYSVAGKLALELECLLLDTKDMSVVSKWWDSAHDALEQWRSIKDTAPQPVSQEPEKQPFNCWSTNDGDSWYEHPADAQLLYDVLGDAPKIGDEFEVSAGWHCVTARYRIVSQDGDDFEVECISHPQDNAAPLAQQDTHATHVVRTKDLTDDEIDILAFKHGCSVETINAVIATYKEKNK